MKQLIGLVSIIVGVTAFSGEAAPKSKQPPTKETKIVLHIHNRSDHHRHSQKLEVFQGKDGFSCKSRDIPKHGIQVRGLKSLESPLPLSDHHPKECARWIRWGKQGYLCHRKGESPVLDDLIRQCTNG